MEFTVTWRETFERKPNICNTTKRVDGLARTTKAKASLARPARARARAEGEPGKNKHKGKGKHHGKKGKEGFHEMEGDEHSFVTITAPNASTQQQINGGAARGLQVPQAHRRLVGVFSSRSFSQLASRPVSSSCSPSLLIDHLCCDFHCLPLLLGPRTYSFLCFGHRSLMCHVDNNCQRCLVVEAVFAKKRRRAATRRKCTAQMLNLGFALLASTHTSSRPSRALCVACVCHTNVNPVNR